MKIPMMKMMKIPIMTKIPKKNPLRRKNPPKKNFLGRRIRKFGSIHTMSRAIMNQAIMKKVRMITASRKAVCRLYIITDRLKRRKKRRKVKILSSMKKKAKSRQRLIRKPLLTVRK